MKRFTVGLCVGLLLFVVDNTWADDVPATEEAVEVAAEMTTPDRSRPPDILAPEPLELPKMVVEELAPGMTLVLIQQKGWRKTAGEITLARGKLDLVGWPDSTGGALHSLQDQATKGYSAQDLSVAKDLNDVSVYSWHQNDESGVGFSAPPESLELAFDLVEEVMLRPSFPRSERKLHVEETLRFYLNRGPSSPSTVGHSALSYAWFDAKHPFGARPDLGEIQKLRKKELIRRHQAVIATAPVEILLVGDLDLKTAKQLCSRWIGVIGEPGAKNPLPAFSPPSAPRVIAVDVPDTKQAVIRVRLEGPMRGQAGEHEFQLANFAFGGHFLSRLNRVLREEKGLTYGVYSRYVAAEGRGHFTISLDVAQENTGVALAEIQAQIQAMATNGISEREFLDGLVGLVSMWNETLLTANSALGFYSDLRENGLSVEQADDRLNGILALSLQEVNESVKTWFNPDKSMLTVVVGPRDTLEPILEKLGLKAEWVEPVDAVLGRF